MDIRLSTAQVAIRDRFAELISDELAPLIRRLGEEPLLDSDDPAGGPRSDEQDPAVGALWRALTDLGATRMLLPAAAGGEDAGQQGAVALLELLGTVAYRGPLLDTMMATEILLRSAARHLDPITEISRGGTVAVAVRETTQDSLSRPGPMSVRAPDVIHARRRLVRGAATASYLLVIGATANEPRAALIKLPHPAVSCRRHDDMADSELYDVRLAGAPVQAWHDDALACWPRLLAQARIRQAAYLVGLSQGALDLATARAAARRQFGQPIGKFQAISFRLAEAAARIEATRWFVRAAAWEADNDAEARLSAAQALAMASDVAGSVTLTGMQVHGAFASTRECDAQIYFRRAQVERVLLGGPARLRAEALPLLLAAQRDRRRNADFIRPAR